MTALTTSSVADTAAEQADGIATAELVVLDMAGTTVRDDGIVERAFERAAATTGVGAQLPDGYALDYVRATMGQSKIEVFTHLAGGDRAKAEEATAAFEAAYEALIAEEGVEAIPGAAETLHILRDRGIRIVFTTGFSPVTRDAILDALDWHGLADTALSPADVGRGRPAPDLVLAAAIRARVSSMSAVVVVGDTASDVASGLAARAGLVVGVLTGAHDEATLSAAGAHAVIASVRGLPELLGLDA
ncbi:phosphonatase-like hydrolase [Microbacterium sp. 2FI]|uniref:phosphonatase-like hydrolase n=1 Tax=Microbacterium sp. 2FI TaxID=2502193 RepID=UPI0010F465CE|nr:phosphonatase-like hydrolase [Microbacterium sp. 2FI]